MKKHSGFVIFFTAIIMIFFWRILSLKYGFIHGDYAEQFYPWSMIYANAVKAFEMPFWTRCFHSGFPLVAEGQVGAFYPLNMIFFFLLPFKVAYNYIVVFHFILAGIFTYVFSRKLGAGQYGGALAALLFCFGSAYAGCFYNTVTVKTLVWFPLVLLLIEKYFDNRSSKYILWAGLAMGLQFLAGFAQVALYSVFFAFLYFITKLIILREIRIKDAVIIGVGLLMAALLFLPQFLLSWQLAGLSSRANATLGFALWGSFPPMNFISLIFPSWIFHGTRLYIGIFSLLFFIAALCVVKSRRNLTGLVVVLLISVFLALGKFNPLYVLLLKLTHLYSFRNPSKILFFGMFAMSVLAGCGLSSFFQKENSLLRQKAVKIFSVFLALGMGTLFIIKGILYFFGSELLKVGKWYVTNHVYGKAYHRYDLETYLDKVEGFYNTMVQAASFTNPYMLSSVIICVISLVVCFLFYRGKALSRPYKSLVIAFIFVDIFIFSFYGTGFRGNIKSYDSLEPHAASIYKIVKSDKDIFRICPFGNLSGELPNWARPNLNAVYGIDSVAAYSPLVVDKYRTALHGLEVVDNSLGVLKPERDVIEQYKDTLRLLNVKYIVSVERLDHSFLKERAREDDVYLYELNASLPRGYIYRKGTISTEESKLLYYKSGKAVFEVTMQSPGRLVFSETNYPGWKVIVDGQPADITVFKGILMSVYLEKGVHKIVFKFDPYDNINK